MPKLTGRRVVLRPYRQEDREHIAVWANDEETTRYLSGIFDLPYTERNADDYLAMVMAGSPDKAAFVIADAETEGYLGQIDLMDIDRRNRSATLGILLARGKDRGRGLGREAIGLICRYGFRTLGLNRIELTGWRTIAGRSVATWPAASGWRACAARRTGTTGPSGT